MKGYSYIFAVALLSFAFFFIYILISWHNITIQLV